MAKIFFGVLVVCLIIVLLGCMGVGKFESTEISNQQAVIYNSEGKPEMVLNDTGSYISVKEASDELLLKRGLIRVGGKVQKQ